MALFQTKKNFNLTILQQHPNKNRKKEYSISVSEIGENARYDEKDNLFGNGFLNADFSSYTEFKKSSLFNVFYPFSEKEFNSAQATLVNLGDDLTLDYLKWFFEFQNISFVSSIGYARIDKNSDNVYYSYDLGIILDLINSGEEENATLKSIYDEVASTKFVLKAFQFKCHNLVELLCAELYFYLSEGYKFKICKHCGKLFPTKNGNIDYCDRNSPLERYSHLKCVEAQQRLRKNSGVNHPLKKRFNVLCSTLDRLIDQKGLPIEEKRIFLETAKVIRKTKTDEEYSEWLFNQELKYKPSARKAVKNNVSI